MIYLILMTWVTLSALFAFNPEHAWKFYSIYAPSMWVAPVVVFATIHDLEVAQTRVVGLRRRHRFQRIQVRI